MPNLSGVFGSDLDAGPTVPSFIGKVILWVSIIVSLLLMLWLSHTFSIPAEPGFSVSLLAQSGWFVSLLVLFIAMALVMLLSATMSSSLRADAPLFCTALACGVISWRGGSMQYTLFAASGPSVFITLAVETVILFAELFVAWQILRKLRGGATGIDIEPATERTKGDSPEESTEEQSLDEKLLALFTQAAAMMAMMILLCRSDAKHQSLAVVFISAAVGAAVAVQLVKVRASFWLWIGPLAVALFGYVFAAFHAEGWQVGLLYGPLAALARPLPLDYVSMGPAGAILGYWMSTSGRFEELLPDAEPT
jgi:hypothetical protein